MWAVQFSTKAAKLFDKLDKPVQKQIAAEIDKIIALENPRQSGKALTSELSRLWRYRAEDYRLVCEIQDNILIILVLRIAHRKEIYK
ncbi:type II toxin-antitoxin system RelE family toxin [Aquella oligotrophica]|uniref:Type II toxin-antitoxin system mRNA interferase toxin, RelE/StbE family n=1 Tax=Aquella oligotrophica TaxID=2067065 RepID=A0A2I7N622_9NEIS|nr:type II toxin-antitoxin system RelE/ParE family toxin [Aquella oligotrophica]AUR51923.1 type II toxin-antitoxin system mRNA interferase toxin, RelE/StbE family [Aquella oligotrophica]